MQSLSYKATPNVRTDFSCIEIVNNNCLPIERPPLLQDPFFIAEAFKGWTIVFLVLYKPITNTTWVRAQLCNLQKRCTRLAAASDKVYQLLAHGRWFSSGTPERITDHGQATGKLYHLRLRVECNLQSRARTHAVLVIGMYELLGNPTTQLIEPPGRYSN